jgi:LysR family transcriptional activator of glutamate synthase operon
MELRQVVYFEAVVRHGGFTRAAEQLHVAQSAISAQVRSLETELGMPLLRRTTRRVALTEAGEIFLERARRALGELDGARADLADLVAILRGRVVIGATAVLGSFDLPGALAGFHARYPGVALTLRAGLIANLLAALDAGDVDLVLGPASADLPAHYVVRRLADEELVIVLPPGHRLAGDRRLTLGDLRDESFVCLAPESGLRAILDAAGAAAGFEPRVQFATHSAASIRELVGAGLGVALMARSAAEAPGRPVVVRVPEQSPAHPPAALIRHRDRKPTPAAEACRRHLIGLATVGRE